MTQSDQSLAVRAVCVLLALIFFAAGIPKIFAAEAAIQEFEKFGYPGWFRVVIGIVEVGSGLGLLIPRFTSYAAMALCVVMGGAFATQIRSGGETYEALVPLVVFAILAGLAWRARPPERSS
jgi:uncharacterized membrane protein YphA (DoxX/SURF4 family)